MHKFKLHFILVVLFLALGGCGSKSDSPNNSNSNPTAQNENAKADSATSEEISALKKQIEKLSSEENSEIDKISDDTVVKRHKSGYYSGGRLMGVPLKSSKKRHLMTLFIPQTYEMEILLGKVPGNSEYVGVASGISTESKKIFEEFRTLNKQEAVVFEYAYPSFFNPEIEHTHVLVTKIIPIKKDFDASGLPKSVKSRDYRNGWYSQNAERRGRIVNVDRRGWGWFNPTCTIAVDQGGLRSNGDGGYEINRAYFSVYGEKACRWTELVMEYDVDVELSYSEDFIEVFHDNCKVAHEIKILEE